MNKFNHCEICDLHSFNFEDGIICSLTSKRPDFQKKCPDIKLDQNLKDKIIEVNTEFEDSKYVKKLAIGNFVFYSLIGVGVLGICYLLIISLFRLARIHTFTIAVFCIGIGFFGIAIGALNYSRRKRKIISPKKRNLDILTELYNVRYEFDSKISTDIMGIKETKINLRLNGEKIEQTYRY
ncbi:hypothetical protein [Maribacter sp. LLG6340-A2]|uniref:hypothetical protein n=1 Tax=Maribacter sp. LLG6340-A2 TaxID=3160834 RepID=UPI0038691BE3